MGEAPALRGFAISLRAEDLKAARRWYTALLGVDPYFQRPGYCEFRVGDYQHEIGLIHSKYAPGGLRVRAVPSCTGTSTTCTAPSGGCFR